MRISGLSASGPSNLLRCMSLFLALFVIPLRCNDVSAFGIGRVETPGPAGIQGGRW